jgi:hypothetical protein
VDCELLVGFWWWRLSVREGTGWAWDGWMYEYREKQEREYVGMLLSLYDNTIIKDSTEHDVYESGFC